MNKLVFSQRGLCCLQRISRILDRELGLHYRLSSQKQLLELLSVSSISPIEEVRHCFNELLDELDDAQREQILAMGVSLPESGFFHSLPAL